MHDQSSRKREAAVKSSVRIPLATKVLPATKNRLADSAKADGVTLSHCAAEILDSALLPEITNQRPLEMLALQAALTDAMQGEALALWKRNDLSDETRAAALGVILAVQEQLKTDIDNAAKCTVAAGAKHALRKAE